MSLSSQKKRPKPWLRKIKYTRAELRNGNLIYGYYDEKNQFIEAIDGLEFKTSVRNGYFEHWGIGVDVSDNQVYQITVAYISDEETGEVIIVKDPTAIKFV